MSLRARLFVILVMSLIAVVAIGAWLLGGWAANTAELRANAVYLLAIPLLIYVVWQMMPRQ